MSFVEQRIAIGLEGVKVSEFVGDIPTWGFTGADNPAGWPTSDTGLPMLNFNYAVIESVDDVLPVWEGVYLALAPADSYTLQFTGTMPSSDLVMTIPDRCIHCTVRKRVQCQFRFEGPHRPTRRQQSGFGLLEHQHVAIRPLHRWPQHQRVEWHPCSPTPRANTCLHQKTR